MQPLKAVFAISEWNGKGKRNHVGRDFGWLWTLHVWMWFTEALEAEETDMNMYVDWLREGKYWWWGTRRETETAFGKRAQKSRAREATGEKDQPSATFCRLFSFPLSTTSLADSTFMQSFTATYMDILWLHLHQLILLCAFCPSYNPVFPIWNQSVVPCPVLLLPDLHIGFSRGRSGGLVFPSLSEFSTVLYVN